MGQLGLGSTREGQYRQKLTQVPGIHGCLAVGCGRAHSMCIARGKTVRLFAWGESSTGRLGLGKVEKDIEVVEKTSLQVDLSGDLAEEPGDLNMLNDPLNLQAKKNDT